MRLGAHRDASAVLIVSNLSSQNRSYFPFAKIHSWKLPGQSHITKEDLEKIRYFDTKSRAQWPYKAIDESVNIASTFRKTDDRPMWDKGTREAHWPGNEASYENVGPHKRLHEYFDEYTKPGTNPKMEALRAVKEVWDSENFYYPGEASRRNRPSFRSVPQEILNKQTWYHPKDWVMNWEVLRATERTRSWNPLWPPPGYKMPKLWTKRELVFGVEDAGLVCEVERWFWYKNWIESNCRQGPYEWITWVLCMYFMYWMARHTIAVVNMKCQFNNMYYPGRKLLRSWGEPKDVQKEGWWWQQPLETFPNQGEIWYQSKCRFGYINYIKKRDEARKIAAAM